MNAHADFNSLPEDVVRSLLCFLGARDLARVMCSSKSLQKLAAVDALWEKHVTSDWRRWSESSREALTEGRFRALYHARLQLDREAEGVVADTVWPLKRKACEAWLIEKGNDVMVRGAQGSWQRAVHIVLLTTCKSSPPRETQAKGLDCEHNRN
jgi:hypothetical protein